MEASAIPPTIAPATATATVLARGPWEPSAIRCRWRSEPFEPEARATAAADAAIAALQRRGSPSHDGLSGRLVDYEASADGLLLTLQPARWSLRLVADDAADAVSVLCVTRAADGRWLAGRRASWLASWAGRWALGAGGAIEPGESPVDALTRELAEEWAVQPERLTIEALLRLPRGMVMVIGLAWLPADAVPVADSEHDALAWWPADVASWPPEADVALRHVGALLTSSS